MKKLITFFAGLMVLVLVFAALYFTAAVYDTGAGIQVEPFFFQSDSLSYRRPGVPVMPEELGEEKMLNMLIEKFVTEYFYVIPDSENLENRISPSGIMSHISSHDSKVRVKKDGKWVKQKREGVFEKWLNDEVPEMREMAKKKMLRLVKLRGPIYKTGDNSKYWVVKYELRTWENPNNLGLEPKITSGTMYLDVTYNFGIPEAVRKKGVDKFLKQGGDPVRLFRFRVNELVQE